MRGTTQKEIVVQKYGGSSLSNPVMLLRVAEYIKKTTESKNVVVVVSAMGKETNQLIELAEMVGGAYPPKRELDRLLATGEERSAALLAMALRRLEVPAVSLNARDIELRVDETGRIGLQDRGIAKVIRHLSQDTVIVITGFQGIKEGTEDIVTLGRGGSDLTAIAVAGALGLESCEIYTDVDGVYKIDPRVVSEAVRFASISYGQMIELSGAGAGVMMDRSVILAQELGIKIKVLLSPSIDVSTGGTLVTSESEVETKVQPGVAIQKGMLVRVLSSPGVADEVFKVLADVNIIDSVQVANEQKVDTTIFCLSADLYSVRSSLQEITPPKSIETLHEVEVAGLTLVDPLMKEESGYLHRVSGALTEAGAVVRMISSSGVAILAVVGEEDTSKAAKALAQEFGLVEPR